MTYKHNIYATSGKQRQPVYLETRQASGKTSMTDDVVLPSLMAWMLFFIGSLGLSFVLVSAKLVPTNDDMITMIGIALGVSAISTLPAFGVLLDRYHERSWNQEITEFESTAVQASDNIVTQTGPRTIARSRYRWTYIQQRDFAVRCFTPAGIWQETTNLADRQFDGIIPDYKHKYSLIRQDFIDAGWVIQVTPQRWQWTENGKTAIWEWYPK